MHVNTKQWLCFSFGNDLLCTKFLKKLDIKPGKNSIFLKKGKTVILVENWKFSRSRMMKRTSPLNSSHEI